MRPQKSFKKWQAAPVLPRAATVLDQAIADAIPRTRRLVSSLACQTNHPALLVLRLAFLKERTPLPLRR
jgi:hypothetical protein